MGDIVPFPRKDDQAESVSVEGEVVDMGDTLSPQVTARVRSFTSSPTGYLRVQDEGYEGEAIHFISTDGKVLCYFGVDADGFVFNADVEGLRLFGVAYTSEGGIEVTHNFQNQQGAQRAAEESQDE